MKVSGSTRLFLAVSLGFVGVGIILMVLWSAWSYASYPPYDPGLSGYFFVFLGLLFGVGFISAFFDAWKWFKQDKKLDLRVAKVALALVFLVSLVAAGYGYYLSTMTYSFSGKVIDEQGKPVPSVKVFLESTYYSGYERPTSPSAVTNAEGVAFFTGLKQGEYFTRFTDSSGVSRYSQAGVVLIPTDESRVFTLLPISQERIYPIYD